MNAIGATVVIEGPSWEGTERGMYCFEVFVNGVRGQVHIQEEIAFDLLGAWTLDSGACLNVLRVHRFELAQALARKLTRSVGAQSGHYLLAPQDLQPGPPSGKLLQFPGGTAPAQRSHREIVQ